MISAISLYPADDPATLLETASKALHDDRGRCEVHRLRGVKTGKFFAVGISPRDEGFDQEEALELVERVEEAGGECEDVAYWEG